MLSTFLSLMNTRCVDDLGCLSSFLFYELGCITGCVFNSSLLKEHKMITGRDFNSSSLNRWVAKMGSHDQCTCVVEWEHKTLKSNIVC